MTNYVKNQLHFDEISWNSKLWCQFYWDSFFFALQIKELYFLTNSQFITLHIIFYLSRFFIIKRKVLKGVFSTCPPAPAVYYIHVTTEHVFRNYLSNCTKISQIYHFFIRLPSILRHP